MRLRTGDTLRRRLGIEPLERREMLTTGISALLDAQGVLRITGTEANDSIFVASSNNKIWVYGQTQQFNVSQVRQIVVNGLGGDDSIRLDSQVVGGWQSINIATTIDGGAGNDFIIGSEAKDTIFGSDGNDVIFGGGGDDYLDGGAGNDVLFGGAGSDTLAGDKGSDALFGEAGNDFLLGGDGNDALYGGDGTDWLDGGRDFDWLYGEAGDDYLFDDVTVTYFNGGAGTNYNLYAHYSWIDMNVSDDALRSLARSAYSDWYFDRNDVLTIFTQVSRDGSVSATEFNDLKGLLGSSANLTFVESVKNLAGKVINGDAGNALYQGYALGNLAAGSAGTTLNSLVNKWFYGSDRPSATISGQTYSYAYAQGSLFVNGATFSDIHQGYLGDCYFMTGLASTALMSPTTIQQMFTDNGDGTFTVKFYNAGRADYVTVDRYLPVDSKGKLVLAGLGTSASSNSNELWVELAEKAYAQLNGSGWLRGASGQNSFSSIAAGYISDAFKQITGRNSTLGNTLNLQSMISAFASGSLVGVASKSSGTASNVVAGHAYTMVGYNTANQTVTLYNPWGGDVGSRTAYVTLTFAQLTQSFSYWDRTV